MAAPILVACLVTLRSEFNTLAPKRDKGADGWIGDLAHQQESSDHNPDETGHTPYEDADSINEVHALDVDKDLGGGLDLTVYVERIRLNHLHGTDNRLQNIIWRGQICSASWGWTWRPYTGASKHFDHAHFSARYTTAQENDARPWGVLEEDDDMTPEQLLGYDPNDANGIPNPFADKAKNKTISPRTALYNAVLIPMRVEDKINTLAKVVAGLAAGNATQADIDELKTLVDGVDEQVAARLIGATPEDTAAVLKAVLGDQAAEVGRILAAA